MCNKKKGNVKLSFWAISQKAIQVQVRKLKKNKFPRKYTYPNDSMENIKI